MAIGAPVEAVVDPSSGGVAWISHFALEQGECTSLQALRKPPPQMERGRDNQWFELDTFLLAEGVGFEPTVSFPTHAFQACRFGRSRIPPCYFTRRFRNGS